MLTGYLAWDLSATQTETRLQRAHIANQHIEYAQDRIRQSCSDTNPAAHLECVTAEVISDQDHVRAESDLDAQQSMALWAKVMAILSGAGLIATAIGIFLVWGTLGQSKVATKAAQDAIAVTDRMGRIQTQAYISFSGTDLVYVVQEGVIVGLQVRSEFKNTGQSPGKIVFGFSDVCCLVDLEVPFRHTVERHNQYRMSLNIGSGEKRWVASPVIKIEQISSALAERKQLVVFGLIEFTDVFDGERRVEDFCVGIVFRSDPVKMENGIWASHDWLAHQDFSVKIA